MADRRLPVLLRIRHRDDCEYVRDCRWHVVLVCRSVAEWRAAVLPSAPGSSAIVRARNSLVHGPAREELARLQDAGGAALDRVPAGDLLDSPVLTTGR